MSSIEKIADLLTHYIVKNEAIKAEDSEIYRYGFLIGIEMFICIATCYGIAIPMGMAKECTVFFLIFFSLRSFVGGVHMSSYKKCFVCSCMVVFLTLLAIKNISLSNKWALGIICCEILIILFLNPVENENRPVDGCEKRIFAHTIKRILVIILGVTCVLFTAGYNDYLVVITYTLGVIIISMLLGKVKRKENDSGMRE
ncbi:MAG: accessory gene regulator B family protein [Clostridiales bacterium]|nr:accessory gene regulator B family protein [Clostridiales bacterium]MDU4755383.1 accessory gene regulator B family protein [Lachnospiraceae bacterium]